MPRAAPRRWLSRARPLAGGAAVLVFVALAAGALVHYLRPVSMAEVVGAVRAIPDRRLALAALAALASYGALIGYDQAALRMLGRTVPARTVALGALSGHAFANTLGWGLLSGGAVRLRLYAAHGLGVRDVAAISALTAAASGIGLAAMVLAVLLIAPSAIAGYLPASRSALLGGAATLLAICALIATGGRARRISARLGLSMPRPETVLTLTAVFLAETGFAAVSLFLLIDADDLTFGAFLPVFLAATAVGLMSHVPGSVGVFEAVVLAGIGGTVPLARVAAALLAFRFVFNAMPFTAAALFLAGREVGQAQTRSEEACVPVGRGPRSGSRPKTPGERLRADTTADRE